MKAVERRLFISKQVQVKSHREFHTMAYGKYRLQHSAKFTWL